MITSGPRDRHDRGVVDLVLNFSVGARIDKSRLAEQWQQLYVGAAAPRGAAENLIKVRVGHDTFGFSYSAGRYTVRWNGARYADGDNRTITKTDNVVIMKVHNHPDGNRDVLGAPSVQSDTVGKGKVTIYRDGKKITGQWKRTKASGPLRFMDKSGDPIALKPGQTWVALAG